MSRPDSGAPLPELRPVDLRSLSDIAISFFHWKVRRVPLLGGVVRFEGKYRRGSAGDNDGLFIRWRINEFCEYPEPDLIYGLVVDFRNLEYEWGDNLDVPADRLRRGNWPVRIVATATNFGPLRTWLGDEVLVDFRAAFQQVEQALRERVK